MPKSLFAVAFALAVAASRCSGQTSEASGASFSELARKIVEHRKAISNGEFLITNRVEVIAAESQGSPRSEFIEVLVDGSDRLRASSRRRFGEIGPQGEAPIDAFIDSVVRSGDALFLYSNVNFGGGDHTPAEIFSVRDPIAMMRMPTDPRLIGLAPYTYHNLSQLTLDGILNHGKYDKRFVGNAETIDGRDCIPLVSVRGELSRPDLRTVMWVDANRDYNVVKIELVSRQERRSLDIELQEVPDYGWFPKAVSYREERDGKPTKISKASIAVRSINEGLEEEEFSLLGMGALIGVQVVDRRGGEVKVMRLTNEGLVPWDQAEERVIE